MAGLSSGPTPWWQLPEYNQPSTTVKTGTNTLGNLQNSAPEGYQYDPVKMAYVKTPQAIGQGISSLLGGINGLQSAATTINGGGVGGAGTTGISGGSPVASIGPIDNSDAMSSAFGRAKDTAGQLARSELDSLRSALGTSGQLGSGLESKGVRSIIEDSANQLGDVNRQQAETQANQALDIAKTNAANSITQRGQDIAAQEAQARLAMEQANINSQRQLDLLRMALSGGSGLTQSLF